MYLIASSQVDGTIWEALVSVAFGGGEVELGGFKSPLHAYFGLSRCLLLVD